MSTTILNVPKRSAPFAQPLGSGGVERGASFVSRIASFAYGAMCYVVFFATFLYAIGFVTGFGVPKGLDSLPGRALAPSLLINLALLGVFAVQHSVMARPTFKRWWTRFVPEHVERSTYTLLSSVALIALFVFWQPMGGTIWRVESIAGQVTLFGLGAAGWLLVLVSTFLLNHFDLFGLRQVWLHLRGRAYTPVKFGTPMLYKHVRHPLYVGWFLAFWATPVMTGAHLLFALATAAYILIAIQLEERNLIDSLGDDYANYRRRVPMLIPFTKRKRAA